MIIFDFSQIVVSSALDYTNKNKTKKNPNPLTLEMLRHLTLNTFLSIKSKLHKYDDEIILAFDNRKYWRKDIFPLYKKHRKKDHEEDSFDWDAYFSYLDILKAEFKESLLYKILEVEKVEADDIIAVLCQEYGMEKDICVSSSDKDFLQLQTNENRVVQYSPWHKKFLKQDNNEYSLFEHIIKGDKSDNIPNILSDDDVYLDKTKRSKSIRSTNLVEWERYKDVPEYFCESIDVLAKYERNKQLIDLSLIPNDIKEQILEAYKNVTVPKKKFFDYLIKHKLTVIMERYV